ncbi:MAG TPA: RNB domain-containing ribonuclease [Longimicrobium sp.]|nr:RNB domain-containing ribonuclease [Longimicrobium sp.]
MASHEIEQALDAARRELGIRSGFPAEAVAEAAEAARRDPAAGEGREDRRELPFITIDPPGSRDLDQALCIREDGGGLRLWYAIADVGAFVRRGGALEAEAWTRGLTYYAPDRKEPLYPPALSEQAASLLPDVDRPAVVFEFALDARAEVRERRVYRGLVRSRAQLTYAQVVEHVLEGGTLFAGKDWAASLPLLKRFGEAREEIEKARGGVSLPLAQQRVQRMAAARLGYSLEFEESKPSEEWNEQVSLLTGEQAARLMLEARVGLLRTMAGPDPRKMETFRRAALALGFQWPRGMTYPEFIHSLDRAHPLLTPLVWQARPVMRGADYLAFDGDPPAHHVHHALAMPYAHVTAPLRRLADRYALDLLVALSADARPSAAELETLAALPKVMDGAESRAAKLERRAVDVAEAWLLRERVGQRFAATVLGARDGGVEVQIEDPPVRASADAPGDPPAPGAHVTVRLARVSVPEGKTWFELVS